MKTIVSKVYVCDHCGKVSLNAGAMTHHERACLLNPANLPLCDNCYWYERYGEETERVHYTNIEGESAHRDIQKRTCGAYGFKLYFKLTQSISRAVNAKGWKRCPRGEEKCERFLTCDGFHKALDEMNWPKKEGFWGLEDYAGTHEEQEQAVKEKLYGVH